MKLRNSLKFFMSFVSVAILTGCTNNSQPVSVPLNTENKFAAIADLAIQDMGWGGGQLWAVSKSATGADYYLARYSSSTSQWQVLTSHYGVKLAVSNSGKCYHVNSSGQLWWVTRNADGTYSNQQINRPSRSSGTLLARDVGAGVYGSGDRIWVRFQSTSGNYYTYYANYSGSGSSATWTEALAMYSGYPIRVAADPLNGSGGLAVSSNNGDLYLYDPDLHVGDGKNFIDAAMCDGYFAAITADSKLAVGPLYFVFPTSISAYSSVAMTKINGVVTVLYINSNSRLVTIPYDNIPQ